MRFLILFSTILLVFACSQEEEITEVTKIFSMDEVSSAGFKVKKDFSTAFPDSTDAKWGFYKGRDVAILRYPTLELAQTSGEIAAKEQTEQIEVVMDPKLKKQNAEDTNKINQILPQFILSLLEII